MTLPTGFLLYVAEPLERLGIPCPVGGSVASSAHGMYRASADADFVIDPTADQLEALARDLESEFHLSRAATAEALARRSTFNAIHDRTSFKIDFFLHHSSGAGDLLPCADPASPGPACPCRVPKGRRSFEKEPRP